MAHALIVAEEEAQVWEMAGAQGISLNYPSSWGLALVCWLYFVFLHGREYNLRTHGVLPRNPHHICCPYVDQGS